MKRKIVFLVGPTAIGKTKVAVYLAKKINAEIISCDSMQVYKGMDILTSKPARILQKKVPHHLISLISPTKEYDVSRYRREAIKIINKIIKKNKTPLFVGGTGLYMSVLIDGIFRIKVNPVRKILGCSKNDISNGAKAEVKVEDIRKRLMQEAERHGAKKLYERLLKVDPEAAGKIHPNDKKRIIRALEVFEVSGKPISLLQKQRKGLRDKFDIRIFCLNMDRDKLYNRISQRVEMMFKQGLIPEVKKILNLKLSRTAGYAIGLRQLKGYFDGQYDLDAAKELIKRDTRWYAKRQLTWFRKDNRIQWINISEKETPGGIARVLLKRIK